MIEPTPVEVHRQAAERRLRIVWADGHSADYDYDTLRGYCPCAACQGHTPAQLVFHPPRSPVDLLRIEQVGNYALSFRWSDGHATGIYRFGLLRALCPCATCRASAVPPPEEHP